MVRPALWFFTGLSLRLKAQVPRSAESCGLGWTSPALSRSWDEREWGEAGKKAFQLAIEIVLERICLFCKECLVIDSNFKQLNTNYFVLPRSYLFMALYLWALPLLKNIVVAFDK